MYLNVECAVIPGATAAAIKIAFDLWRKRWEAQGIGKKAIVLSATMFGVTDLIVFYYCVDL